MKTRTKDPILKLANTYPFSAGGSRRPLPLGDHMPFVEPDKEAGVSLRGHCQARMKNPRKLPTTNQKRNITLSAFPTTSDQPNHRKTLSIKNRHFHVM